MPEITDKTLEEIKIEYKKWAEYLNGVLGILSFSFGLSCLGTPWPDTTGFFSLCFLILLGVYGKNRFPEKIRELRKADLKGIDELTLIGIEKKYFGLGALLFKFPVFLTGWLFLGGVSVFGVWH